MAGVSSGSKQLPRACGRSSRKADLVFLLVMIEIGRDEVVRPLAGLRQHYS